MTGEDTATFLAAMTAIAIFRITDWQFGVQAQHSPEYIVVQIYNGTLPNCHVFRSTPPAGAAGFNRVIEPDALARHRACGRGPSVTAEDSTTFDFADIRVLAALETPPWDAEPGQPPIAA
jgi:hypothetical protein